jgi:hypothetical protein
MIRKNDIGNSFRITVLMFCLALTACGGGGGGGGASPEQLDLNGTWTGTWESSVTASSGALTVHIFHDFQSPSVTSTINISHSPCISSATASGTASQGSVSFTFVSGVNVMTLDANYTATSIGGTYSFTSGPCAGDHGTFSLSLSDIVWLSTSTTGAPSARRNHTAVWTGSRMLVWGGFDGSNTLNTGGIYDPATDSWAAITTTGAPSAGRNHTAVWTGSKMLVWGGQDGSTDVNTGGIYDPATNSWAVINTTGAPSARARHTAVWTGSKMLVWGGEDGTTQVNTGGIYDPATDSWTDITTTGAPSARLGGIRRLQQLKHRGHIRPGNRLMDRYHYHGRPLG